MDLTTELVKLSFERAAKANKKHSKAQASARRKEEDKSKAQWILEKLPDTLRYHARSFDKRRYEVLQLRSMSSDTKPKDLFGLGRIVYKGCKKMGLKVEVGYSEYLRGISGASCAGIWVHW